MELREYFRIISRYGKFFWGMVILATLAAFLLTRFQPQTYLASTTLTVNKSSHLKQSEINYYLFDNYYNIQSAGLFSQIVANWFESPALVKEIYEKSGLDLPKVSQKKLSKTFKAVREEPATINVSLTDTDKSKIERLINASAQVMQEKTNELGKADPGNTYDIIKFQPIVTQTTPNLWLNTLIGFFVGAILGIIFGLGIDYFRKEE